MRDGYRFLILMGLFLNGEFTAAGQKIPSALVTANFRNANMEQFVSELENQTGLHFYYNPDYTDSIKINLSVTSQPVEKIMDAVFAGSDFYYSIDDEAEVFISKGVRIVTSASLKSFLQDN